MKLIYLESSAVVKLFLEEPFSAMVASAVGSRDAHCVTSDLTYAEIHGLLSRAVASGRATAHQQRQLVKEFQAWFDSIARCAISQAQIRRAGTLAIQHNLRGADSIHLAAALECAMPGLSLTRVFACFDERLTREAQKTGMFDECLTRPDLA